MPPPPKKKPLANKTVPQPPAIKGKKPLPKRPKNQ